MAAQGEVRIKIKADTRELDTADKSVKKFTGSILAARAIEGVFKAVSASLGDAIERFDTLNRYPKVLQAVGFSAEESERSLAKLSDGIQGLPTRLDEVASTALRLALIMRDLDAATDTTLALNNAFLASGASSEAAGRGLEQYIQMLSVGKPDMAAWRTLMETMGVSLFELAEGMGFDGPSAAMDLYKALRDGNITFADFNSKLMEMDKGVGGFAEKALIGSEGIKTSMANIRTAVVNATERVIRAFDEVSREVTGNSIAQNINKGKDVIVKAADFIAKSVKALAPVFQGLFSVISAGVNLFKTFDFAVLGLVAAFAALKVIQTVYGSLMVVNSITLALSASTGTYSAVLGVLNGQFAAATIAQKVFAVAAAAAGGGISLATVATTAFNAVLKANPIGLVVAAIGLLVAAVAGIVKWFKRVSDEGKQMAEEMEGAASASDDLASSVEDNARLHERHVDGLKSNSAMLRTLAEETVNLSKQENLSAGSKKLLKDKIEELNGSVEGLSLSYNEETGNLSMSTEAIYARIDAMESEAELIATQERLAQVSKERAEIELQLESNTRLMNEAAEQIDETEWHQIGTRSELKGKTEELEESNEELRQKLTELGTQSEILGDKQIALAEEVAAAEEASKNTRINSLDQLNEKNRQVAEEIQNRSREHQDATINGFKKIEENAELSFENVAETLRSNIDTMREWSDNMQTLANQGVDQGLLNELARLGPEGGPLVEELVINANGELEEMEALFAESGANSRKKVMDELGIPEGTIVEGLPELIFNSGEAWADGIDASGISKAIPEAIAGGAEDAVAAGADVMAGAAQGVAQDSSFESSLVQQADAGNQAFAGALGIQSPSTVFMAHGRDLMTGLTQGIQQGTNAAVALIGTVGAQMNASLESAVNGMASAVTVGSSRITRAFQAMGTNLRQTMSQIATNLRSGTSQMDSILSSGTSRMQTTLQMSMQKMATYTRLGITNIQTEWKAGVARIFNDTNSGFLNVVNVMESQLNRAPGVARSISNSTASSLSTGISSARSAGYNTGMGFNAGLSSSASRIYATARSIANNVAATLRKSLQVRSPSRITREIGQFTGEGLAVGISDATMDVERASRSLGKAAIPDIDPYQRFKFLGVGSSASGSVSTITSGDTTNIFIDGVAIDMSDPESTRFGKWLLTKARMG